VFLFVVIVIRHFMVIVVSGTTVSPVRAAVVTGGQAKADGDQGNGKS
jgi:hypothetical protein